MGTQPPTPPIEIDKFFRRQSVLPLARAQRQRFDRIFPSVGPSVELQPSEGKDVQNFSFTEKLFVKKVHQKQTC